MIDEDISVYGPVTTAESSFITALQGYTIQEVGMTNTVTRVYDGVEYPNRRLEGGLTFILTNGTSKKKVILGYTELGEWIEYEGAL